MSSFGNRLMKERRWYASRNVSVGDAHSWNGLGVVILRGKLGSCSLSWNTKSSLWGERKRDGEKGSRWWEEVCTREVKQHSYYLFQALFFLPLETAIISSGLWGLWKRFGGCVCRASIEKIAVLCVNFAWKFVTEMLGDVFTWVWLWTLRGIAKYLLPAQMDWYCLSLP